MTDFDSTNHRLTYRAGLACEVPKQVRHDFIFIPPFNVAGSLVFLAAVNTNFYLEIFQNAAEKIDKDVLAQKKLEVATGLYGDSVFLKLYNRSWANPPHEPLTAKTRIFFSIWISDAAIAEQKLLYNIHALKLRHLPGYSIASKKFAGHFRASFTAFEKQWPNVSLNYGPLTLMQGWIKLDADSLQNEIIALSNNFLTIQPLIDQTLAQFKL